MPGGVVAEPGAGKPGSFRGALSRKLLPNQPPPGGPRVREKSLAEGTLHSDAFSSCMKHERQVGSPQLMTITEFVIGPFLQQSLSERMVVVHYGMKKAGNRK